MSYRSQSQEDFAKARNKALFNELQHFLNPEETQLLSLEDAKKIRKLKKAVVRHLSGRFVKAKQP